MTQVSEQVRRLNHAIVNMTNNHVVPLEHLEWILKILSDALEAIPSMLSIEPRIYITGSKAPTLPLLPIASSTQAPSTTSPSTNTSNPNIEEEEKPGLPAYSALKIIHGRPSIPKLLHNEISVSSGSVSVDGASSLPEVLVDNYSSSGDSCWYFWISVFLSLLVGNIS